MWLLPISILVVTTLLAIPLSKYLSWIMDGKYRPWGPFRFIENKLNSGPQNWKQYTGALLLFNTVLFVFGFIVLFLQPFMPLNDLGRGMLAPSTIFHSVISFMTNTDLQHYSGDQHFSNFSQIFFCLTNFFLSASIGFCGLTAIIRALRSDPHMGNFFVDMWRVVMYTFLPVSFALALIFLQQGAPMTLRAHIQFLRLNQGRWVRQTTASRSSRLLWLVHWLRLCQ
jgi:K+-transporting ATPase ATPase A chain